MPIRQITIIGTGLIGGSLGLALKKRGFAGRIIGFDRPPAVERALTVGAIDEVREHLGEAVLSSELVVLATPVGAILDLISRLGSSISSNALITDVGSTKAEVLAHATKVFGKNVGQRFLAGHPMAGKENSGIEFADPDLFQNAGWFFCPSLGQKIHEGVAGEFLEWVERLGARPASLDAAEHDQLCAWISHLPQLISTALAATLVDEYGEDAPLLDAGGRALKEMTRISSSPYSMWRDVFLTNKANVSDALLKLEQRLAHLRENLDSRELEREFDRAHHLRKSPPKLSS
jgi:prephenate dehydrogenase